MQVDWDRGRRIRSNLIYVTLQNDKVQIEYDGMVRGITQDLIAAGIGEDAIALTFLDEPQPIGQQAIAGGGEGAIANPVKDEGAIAPT